MICIVVLGLGVLMGLGWAVEFLCGVYLISPFCAFNNIFLNSSSTA